MAKSSLCGLAEAFRPLPLPFPVKSKQEPLRVFQRVVLGTSFPVAVAVKLNRTVGDISRMCILPFQLVIMDENLSHPSSR